MADARTVLAQRNAVEALAERDGVALPTTDAAACSRAGRMAEASAQAEAERNAMLAIGEAAAARSATTTS